MVRMLWHVVQTTPIPQEPSNSFFPYADQDELTIERCTLIQPEHRQKEYHTLGNHSFTLVPNPNPRNIREAHPTSSSLYLTTSHPTHSPATYYTSQYPSRSRRCVPGLYSLSSMNTLHVFKHLFLPAVSWHCAIEQKGS